MIRLSLIACLAVLAGGVSAGLLLGQPKATTAPAAKKPASRLSDPEHDLAGLQSRLAMVMADYHATNLWFAGRAQNWPLANYYWEEVVAHMDLSAQADPSGKMQARLKRIVKAIDESPTMQVDEAIKEKDVRAFGLAYRGLLVGCYDCHKVAGLPFLRPQMPVRPSRAIINMSPDATWPK